MQAFYARTDEFIALHAVTIGLTLFAYLLPAPGGMRKSDFDKLLNHLQDEVLYNQTGKISERPASKLYNEWVQQGGGFVCGLLEKPASEAMSADVIQIEKACLLLDSRQPSSSSGAVGETIWSDISNAGHNVDVSPNVLAPVGGFYHCVPDLPLCVRRTSRLTTALSGDFTLTILAQCASVDGDFSAHAPPISLMDGQLTIGAGRSYESLAFAAPEQAVAMGDLAAVQSRRCLHPGEGGSGKWGR